MSGSVSAAHTRNFMLWKPSISCTWTLGQPLCVSPWPWVCCTEASRTQSRGLVDLNTNRWGWRSLLLSWKKQNQNQKNLVSLAVKVYIHRLFMIQQQRNSLSVSSTNPQMGSSRKLRVWQRQGDCTFPKAMLVQDPRKKELQSAKEASSLPASSYFVCSNRDDFGLSMWSFISLIHQLKIENIVWYPVRIYRKWKLLSLILTYYVILS